MATIRRIPSVEHNFQLVITRVYDEGDQELLEDEEESTFLYVCLFPALTLL
jgi:VID27 N-terminal region